MLKKTIAYTDYNGTTRKEDFYFNLTQAEVTELEVSVEGGLVEMINRIVAAQNGKVIIETFTERGIDPVHVPGLANLVHIGGVDKEFHTKNLLVAARAVRNSEKSSVVLTKAERFGIIKLSYCSERAR